MLRHTSNKCINISYFHRHILNKSHPQLHNLHSDISYSFYEARLDHTLYTCLRCIYRFGGSLLFWFVFLRQLHLPQSTVCLYVHKTDNNMSSCFLLLHQSRCNTCCDIVCKTSFFLIILSIYIYFMTIGAESLKSHFRLTGSQLSCF